MKHVVILGAGFGGLELTGRLSDAVADEVRVTLIDQNDSFTFGFSKLDILFGKAERSALQLQYRDLVKPGVEFRQERITAIDPAGRHVTTDQGSYDANILVVALGAEYDLDAVPGFAEDGLEYYSIAGAERLYGWASGGSASRRRSGSSRRCRRRFPSRQKSRSASSTSSRRET